MSTWANASNFVFLRHAVPGSSGVNSLRAYVTFATNAAPAEDTAYFAINENTNLLMILHARKDGRFGFTKEYSRTEKFDVVKHVAHKLRTRDLTQKDAELIVMHLAKRVVKAKT